MEPTVVLASHVSATRADVRLLFRLHDAELVSRNAVWTAHGKVSGQSNCGGTHLLPFSCIEVFRGRAEFGVHFSFAPETLA